MQAVMQRQRRTVEAPQLTREVLQTQYSVREKMRYELFTNCSKLVTNRFQDDHMVMRTKIKTEPVA